MGPHVVGLLRSEVGLLDSNPIDTMPIDTMPIGAIYDEAVAWMDTL